MACLTWESGQRSQTHGLGRGGPLRPLEAAVRRRCSHDPVLGSPSDLPEANTTTRCPVADNEVEYVDSSRNGAQREEIRDEELTNDSTGAANPPDTATDRDSRLPPSNHTRTCNKLPDVYM